MSCPICDQKAMNCDCTESEIALHDEAQGYLDEIKELKNANESLIHNKAEITKSYDDLNKKVAELCALCKEADDYLNTNHMTSIGHGSILHQKFQQAARGDEL